MVIGGKLEEVDPRRGGLDILVYKYLVGCSPGDICTDSRSLRVMPVSLCSFEIPVLALQGVEKPNPTLCILAWQLRQP